MYDNSAMENLMKSMEAISKFRESQFDKVKAGIAAISEVISINPVYMKAGIPSPTVSFMCILLLMAHFILIHFLMHML